MKTILVQIVCCFLVSLPASAAVRYVDLNNPNPAAPYTSWTSAATTIQDAVDAAESGETVLVTNGVYATGGRAVHGTMTNRVAVDKPVHLLSVNGPQFTVIQGYQVPGITNGDGAIRCVYLTNGATLSGFTLTNGATRATNDYVKFQESSGGGVHCEALQSYLDPPIVVSNCIITGNSAFGHGGGAYGGGVFSAQIIDCELRGNTAQFGGGVAEGWVRRCLIADNAAENGGGASEAYGEAGGFEYYSCKLDNCLLVGNRAQFNGGGAYACELYNCTVTGNSAGQAGGGLFGFFVIQVQAPSRAVNSIVFSNTAPSDENFVSYACNLENSCTTPLPGWGFGNITNAPLFMDFAGRNCRLQSISPCVNAGTNSSVIGDKDLDGNPRIRGGTVDMGAFEFQESGSAPVHYVNLDSANPMSPYVNWATAATNIQDAIDVASPGDEILVANGVYATGGRAVHGTMTNRIAVTKPVTVRSVNGPQFATIQGWQVPGTTNGDGAIRCVYLTNGASISGFTLVNGATRTSLNDQERDGGGIWAESSSAVISNCVIALNAAWGGGGATYSGTLFDSTLANNTAVVGGGAYGGAILNRCRVMGNSASGGGGAWGPITMNNCLVAGNSASQGGGVYGSTFAALFNCTIVSNTAFSFGGGVVSSNGPIINCVIYYNQAQTSSNHFIHRDANATNSCMAPLPSSGAGNITNAPLFVDFDDGDFRLQANSPCVDTGNNNYVMGATDFDGAPRVRGSATDMGAYEFQGSQPVLKVARSAGRAVLSWPQWASDFSIQQIEATPMTSAGWSNLVANPIILNNENSVSVPLEGTQRLFRLFKP